MIRWSVCALTALGIAVIAPDTIPQAAAALAKIMAATFDDGHALEILSDENTQAGEEPYVSRISVQGDVWLMRQWNPSNGWASFGLTIVDGRAYFASLDGRPRLHGTCASCHANGPRALRGTLLDGEASDIARFNARIEGMMPIRPYYPVSQRPSHLDPLLVPGCTECHDGFTRRVLTRENAWTIGFRLGNKTMPPGGADVATTRAVRAWLAQW